MNNAQVVSSKAVSNASKSFAFIVLNPSGYGAKQSGWNLSCPVAVNVASVLPWNDDSSVTIVFLLEPPFNCPYFLASFIAASFASAPEFAKYPFSKPVAFNKLFANSKPWSEK